MSAIVLICAVVFCARICSAAPVYLPANDEMSREQIIEHYFSFGFSYAEILVFLLSFHAIPLSLAQLKRILRSLGLYRRKGHSDIETVVSTIETELTGAGRDLGYRSMHSKLRKTHGLVIDRETVRIVLRHLDLDGVIARQRRRLKRREYRSKGPNYIWHLDGWDKLKQFGLSVHGCIDGFSRRIMWLEASKSNKDPAIVCQYFADSVNELGGLPCVIRTDRGSENVNIESMQTTLRGLNGDHRGQNNTSFLYGTSPSNQRIEAWWSLFPNMGMSRWIDHMKELEEFGIFDVSNKSHLECIRFCYIALLQKELYSIRELWNTHYIRRSRNPFAPSGKPDVMFFMPEVYEVADHLKAVNEDDMEALSTVLCKPKEEYCPIHGEIFQLFMEGAELRYPSNLDEADILLVHLLDMFENTL